MRDVPLAPFTTLGVGGPARYLVEARTAADVQAVAAWGRVEGRPLFLLGGGSNVVIADEGWDGIVARITIGGIDSTGSGDAVRLRVGAGEPWDAFVEHTVQRELSGLECLSGIPGSVGGTPIQNVGAYGQEVAAVIDEVRVCDLDRATVDTLPAEACAFDYRTSRFKHADAGRYVVCDVTFRLRAGAPTVSYPDVIAWLRTAGVSAPTVADVRHAVMDVRRRKGMVLDPADTDTCSVGSFFTNPIVSVETRDRVSEAAGVPVPAYPMERGTVKIPAAWLIERSGIDRLRRVGGAALSTKHPLAVVNRGGATARDVITLALEIKRRVIDTFGIALRPEPVFVGFGADREVAALQE